MFKFSFTKTRNSRTTRCVVCFRNMNKGSKRIQVYRGYEVIGYAHPWHKNDPEALEVSR